MADRKKKAGPAARKSDSKPGPKEKDQADWDRNLDSTVIAIPLFEEFDKFKRDNQHVFDIIIDLLLTYREGRESASERVKVLLNEVIADLPGPPNAGLDEERSRFAPQYHFARLTAEQIRDLVRRDTPTDEDHGRAIYKIWLDHDVGALLTESVSTVKADAARVAFAAAGKGVIWAVVDSGIEGDHDHFQLHENLALEPDPSGSAERLMEHKDFTSQGSSPCTDEFGHGTHVAAIIAGEYARDESDADGVDGPRAYVRELDANRDISPKARELPRISGVAPFCKLLSLKVLNGQGKGKVSNIIAALGYIQHVNEYGRWLHIQGVNLSVGYEYEAEWFACGQSPLCVEVDRLVRSGVVVVTAAGNTGYGSNQTAFKGPFRGGLDVTINDPGNAELAITVGSTHREKPHVYGVSYFSSKGPTGDGRLKPDLVAPGERIISAAAGKLRRTVERDAKALKLDLKPFQYVESSGTSMAAPHVSGSIAAFLSIRREFVGQPRRVKEIFLSTATDLNRERYFQGMGLVDLMRAIQSV